MMKKLLIILCACLCVYCKRANNDYSTFKWQSVDKTCDSLLNALDNQYIGFTPLDSMQSTLYELESADSAQDGSLGGYVHYWRGRLLIRQGSDSLALECFKKSMQSDSTEKGYLYHRARYYVNYLSGADNNQQFDDMLSDMDYYEEIGDSPMQAITTGRIGNLFFSYGDYSTALQYATAADSIFDITDIKEGRLKNSLNLSNSLYYAQEGDKVKADTLLKQLLAYKDLCMDPDVCKSTLRNAYLRFNDTASLMRAASISFKYPKETEEHAIYSLLLGSYYLQIGRLDSADLYSQRALTEVGLVDNSIRKAMIYDLAANIKKQEGKSDSVIYFMSLAADEYSLFIQENESSRLIAMENARKLAVQENEKIRLKLENRLRIIIVISVAAAIIAAIMFYIFKKRRQNELREMKYEMEIQRINKDVAAMALFMEEKDNLFTSIMKKLSEMRADGTVQHSVASKLESTISIHLGNNEERNNLQTIIKGAAPKFAAILAQKHPNLNDYYVKLAMFIYLGMDTKQIAKMLMVRPESINQSRWRLRDKLGLTSNDSLDSYLRSLGK